MKYLKIFSVVVVSILSTLLIYSCSQDDNASEVKSELSKSEIDLRQALKTQYGADLIKNENGSFTFNYNDGSSLEVIPNNDGSFTMQGTKISNRIFKINKLENTELSKTNGLDFSFVVLKDFDANPNAKPCSQHPKGETFNQCFKQEWSDFCDGLVGCLAQATNPHLVAAAIAAHCAAC